jgi:formylglycine-generating enzyme
MRNVPSLTFFWLPLSLLSSMESMRFSQADDGIPKTIGIVETQPQSGPFVPIDEGKGGYMVPYVQQLGNHGLSFDMIPVPGGRVTVGSSEKEPGHRPDESPTFTVELGPFWIGKTEVTWGEFEGFIETHRVFKRLAAKGIRNVTNSNRVDAVTVPTLLYDPPRHKEYGDNPKHPAVTMTQYSAKQYTKWLSGITGVQYRLPTEAEWEYAARAGSESAYCYGDNPSLLDEYAVHSQTSSSLVGSKKPNLFGLHDMHGSVWEWTVEQYTPNGYVAQAGKTFAGLEGTQWTTTLNSQCVRGGCWNDPPERVRSASRMGSDRNDWAREDPEVPQSPWWYTSDPARMVGMRLVRSAKPLSRKLIDKFWENEIQELQDDINATVQEGRGIEGLPIPELLKELKWK